MGLGSGRRAMKSPPLLIAVLLACVFVLGINYWITSTRCVELQSQVVELEGRVRRAAAERGAVEVKKNEYEDMLAKQKRQIDNIQSLHSSQIQNMHVLCHSEKEHLLNNLTSKDALLQNLQGQIRDLYKELDDSKGELKDLQESQAKKLSFELTQCSIKMSEMNEQCEEKLRRAAGNVNTAIEDEVKMTKSDKAKTLPEFDSTIREATISKVVIAAEQSKPTEDMDKPVYSTPEYKGESNALDLAEDERKPSPTHKNLKKVENDEDMQEPPDAVNPDSVNPDEEDDEPKVEDLVDKDTNVETSKEEVERENLINLNSQPEDDKGTKLVKQEDAENPNDYNGDEANEAEPEADKQAQLIDNDKNLKDGKIPNLLNAQPFEQEPKDNDDPTLK